MSKKRLLVLGPVTAVPQHLLQIKASLAFLSTEYTIEMLDPLLFSSDAKEDFYQQWQLKLAPIRSDYDAFIGFSFGGMILQQLSGCWPCSNVKMILFSAPSHVDKRLRSQLQQVVSDCEKGELSDALTRLYQWVYAPGKPPPLSVLPGQKTLGCQRLIQGLNLVMACDLRSILNSRLTPSLHFYGECSQLVGKTHITASPGVSLIEVAQSGMRVLEDQPEFCKLKIREYLQL